jgi:hypothetical protein
LSPSCAGRSPRPFPNPTPSPPGTVGPLLRPRPRLTPALVVELLPAFRRAEFLRSAARAPGPEGSSATWGGYNHTAPTWHVALRGCWGPLVTESGTWLHGLSRNPDARGCPLESATVGWGIRRPFPRGRGSKVYVLHPKRAPASLNDEGLADAGAAGPFRLPRLHPGIGFAGSDAGPAHGGRSRRPPTHRDEVGRTL